MARAAAAEADDVPARKKGPSVIAQAAMFLVVTAAAAGAGWFAGGMLRAKAPPAAAAAAPAGDDGHGDAGGHGKAAGTHGEAGSAGHGEAGAAAGQTLFNLPPITTNLAAPSDIWARMEVSVEFDQPPRSMDVVEAIHQDLLGFLRTVKMHQIEGASGIQHLKADLEDRASIRSEGRVRRVYIRTLLFE